MQISDRLVRGRDQFTASGSVVESQNLLVNQSAVDPQREDVTLHYSDMLLFCCVCSHLSVFYFLNLFIFKFIMALE